MVMNALRIQQTARGGMFEEPLPVPVSFGNEAAAHAAVQEGVAVCDRSHWGRLRVTDSDRLRFLHNQTTNQIEALQPGQGCDTVFVTSTARTLDLATAYVEEAAVLLLVSPGQAIALSEWMDRYIFFADKVKIHDETAATVAFSLLGPQSTHLLTQLNLATPPLPQQHSHHRVPFQDTEILIALGSGLTLPGFTIIVPAAVSADLWQSLVDGGAVPLGEDQWQYWRIEQGRPQVGRELTEEYNPLEAGLWQAVSFEKGCYIGQETIARLNTYQGVKQQLWGLQLGTLVEPGTAITVEDTKVGVLTSCVATAEGAIGLGYIRTKAGGEGLVVTVGEMPAKVLELPFVNRGYLSHRAEGPQPS